MAISELSVLISAEQDVKLANKDHGRKISEEETQSSQSDFFSQLQSANNAVETPNNKLSAPELQDAVETESNQETNKTQRDPAISGDEMLAQINAANNLDTNVNSTRSDQSATSVIDLLDKYSQEKLDPGLVKVNAPRPIDAVTPILDGIHIGKSSEHTTTVAEVLKQETGSIEEAASLKSPERSLVTSTNNDKNTLNQLSEDTAKALKEAVAGASGNPPSEKSAVLTAALSESPEISRTVQTLLNLDENALKTNDKILTSFSTEQQTKLQAQVDALAAQGVTPQGTTILKQTIAQFLVNNGAVNSTDKDAATAFDTSQLGDEIAKLSTSEKQALGKQLQQFVANEKPQSTVLNQVNAALAELEGKSVTKSKEPLVNGQTLMQVENNTPLESSKMTSGHSATGGALSQDQANKQVVQQSVVKEQVMVDKDNAEALAPRETPVARVNQLFAQITTAANQITNSAVTGMNEVIDQRYQQEIADMQLLNAQQTTATSQSKQINVDPTLLQALNIVKSDAAKLLQERVSALLNINNKEAEIRLDPPEMGSMQIRIRSDAEQAQINFVVQNQQAKEALEQSMPKLREMLAEQGIELGESSIQQGDSQENMAEQQQQNAQGQLAQQDDEATDVHASTENTEQQSSSSIDYYA
ncbi:flagellar hook-length control protein FliK [Pseudoalteromonas shioyasakiensis]|uniref:flagellar hook-length control protein FliK n=1 Tax=Pseudoalteromonas shioyasakiensis TaxID=1190813 RepID=UPI00211890C2|nr:flagellar hook-length control protein FliK [Pseudoalteromonas shioyasakiensis]MCQ8877889.1 flagellar hook-length control protein FliK [Pseudoalteromonas shioyasakiensis]